MGSFAKIKYEKAHNAIEALGFGDNGSSEKQVRYVTGIPVYSVISRTPPRNIELQFSCKVIISGHTQLMFIYCTDCNPNPGEDTVSALRWCKHLEEVVKYGYDAVALHVEEPMTISVPVIPSWRSWKTVDLKPRQDFIHLEDPYDDEEDPGDDPGYPYEAWLVRHDRDRKVARDYIGMYNKFDGLNQMRRLIFDWIAIADPIRDNLFGECSKCMKPLSNADQVDRILIILESVCKGCIHDMVQEQERQWQRQQKSADVLDKLRNDSELIPDIDSPTKASAARAVKTGQTEFADFMTVPRQRQAQAKKDWTDTVKDLDRYNKFAGEQ